MSKKKALNTMTLKDFHGGSIPPDLPLPSAPGVIARPPDRLGFDRQGAWVNPMGRSEHRLRPGSAGAVRSFDDKTPFLSPNAPIGRNFDEDERKPLDGVSGPRRTISDESIRPVPIRSELKPDYTSTGTLPGQRVLSQASHVSSITASSYAGRVSEATHIGVRSQNFGSNNSYSARFVEAPNAGVNSSNLGGNNGQAASGRYPNAWAIRKETVSVTEPLPATWSGPNAASKLAHASALEKVSSGRWQNKQPIQHPTEVEVITHTAIESDFRSKDEGFYNNKSSYHPTDMSGGVEYHDALLARYAQRSLAVDCGIQGSGKELPTNELVKSPKFPQKMEIGHPSYVGGIQPARNGGNFGGSEFQSRWPTEQSERPKVELHPRRKPLESFELPVNYKKGYQQPHNSDHLENTAESYGNAIPTKSGLSGSDSSNAPVERPKLNLKPRSQPLEQLKVNVEGERNSVFGGARPRELVLKERGIDDVAVDIHDVAQSPNRVKQDVPRTETVSTHSTPIRHNGKPENTPLDNRIRKNNDRPENRVDVEKTDMQKRNWRSENRNNKETEKHHHHQPQQQQQQQQRERAPSPETWRKPAEEQLKPASADASGPRGTKAASAVELAQAFSRSVSDPKTMDQFPNHRGVPSRVQMPFSRLMDPTSRSQINGY